MSYEVKIRQRTKGYDEEIAGTCYTFGEAQGLAERILKAFPKTRVTISVIETEAETTEPDTNITAEAETNTEED